MKVLLINPWIYDFAAFDMWSMPLGLLSLAGVLKQAGHEAVFIDCVSRHHPAVAGKTPPEKPFHTGKFFSVEIEKPPSLSWLQRRYKRHGIPEEAFRADLTAADPVDAVLVTSRMTYWYPGVRRCIEIIREELPGTPVALGGIYASLCPDHARRTCAPDFLWRGEGEAGVLRLLEEMTGRLSGSPPEAVKGNGDMDHLPMPEYGLLYNRKALAIETSRGCPFRCDYCASGVLFPRYRRKSPGRVADEIEAAVSCFGTEDFAFYDDALLHRAQEHFVPMAREVIRRGIRARHHLPNSVFASHVTPEVAGLMKEMGFRTIRLSLESTNPERLRKLNRGITADHFAEAMRNLTGAGFKREDIGAYILAGLPGQTSDEVIETARRAWEAGAVPRLAQYSPIPGTPHWTEAVSQARMDIASEPLLHNDTVYHYISGAFTEKTLDEIKVWRSRLVRGDVEGGNESIFS